MNASRGQMEGAETSSPPSLSVVILTFNEERHIERAIASVWAIATEVVVVDSYSTDATVALARAAGARVLEHAFVNQAKQFNWALENAAIESEWILRLDADEVIESDLASNLARRLPQLPADVAAVSFNRKHIFMGRWIKHGGRYPLVLTRLWRRGHGRVEDRWMDEHVIVTGGRTILIEGGFADVSLHDLTRFIDKHNKYATREAVEILNWRHKFFADASHANLASPQASRKRYLKENLFNFMPLFIGPFAYFIYRYVFQLGILDGRAGLIYHILQAFWYRFLINAKVLELETEMTGCAGSEERLARLTTLTGLRLDGD